MDQILLPNTTNSSSNNNNNKNLSSSSSSFERRVIRPQKEASTPVNCPRCDSTNTKFCYYNNYSLSQPRYFCKTCRRYWTAGGTLRNIPIGGGSRKSKRSSSSSSISSSKFPDLGVLSASTPVLSDQNPRIHHDQYGQDLNLGFSSNFKNVSEFIQVPNFNATQITNSSALDLLTGTTTISHYNPVYTPMIPLSEFKIPTLSFSLDGGGVYRNNSFQESNGGKLLFPFEEVKTDTLASHDGGQSTKDDDQNSGSNGFWNGMMGGSNS